MSSGEGEGSGQGCHNEEANAEVGGRRGRHD